MFDIWYYDRKYLQLARNNNRPNEDDFKIIPDKYIFNGKAFVIYNPNENKKIEINKFLSNKDCLITHDSCTTDTNYSYVLWLANKSDAAMFKLMFGTPADPIIQKIKNVMSNLDLFENDNA